MSHISPAHGAAVRTYPHTAARLVAVLGLIAGVLAALVVAPSTAQASTRHHRAALGPSARKVARALTIARNQRGKPYVYGADGPRAFDCSGLTSYSYRRAGFLRMPRTSSAQSHFARHIRRSHMHVGDLMFFYDGGGVYHVGVYDGLAHGRRLVLHAPRPGERVHVQPVWTNRWFPGTLRYR